MCRRACGDEQAADDGAAPRGRRRRSRARRRAVVGIADSVMVAIESVARARRIDHPQRLAAGAEFADRHVESARGQLLANAGQAAPGPRRRGARLQQRHPSAGNDRRGDTAVAATGARARAANATAAATRACGRAPRSFTGVRRSQRARGSGIHALREPAQVRAATTRASVGSLLPLEHQHHAAPSPRQHKLRKALRAGNGRTRRARPMRDRRARRRAAPAGTTPPRRATSPGTDGAGRASRAGPGRLGFGSGRRPRAPRDPRCWPRRARSRSPRRCASARMPAASPSASRSDQRCGGRRRRRARGVSIDAGDWARIRNRTK